MTEQKLEGLLLCPFCGGGVAHSSEGWNTDNGYKVVEYVSCLKCGGGMEEGDESKSVKEEWNTRASATREVELQAEVERLREALEVYASERMWIECEGGKRTTVSWKNSSGGDSSFGKLTHLWRGHVGELHPNEVAKQALNHKD